MLRIAHEAINPILKQYGCPEINLRIGVDIGQIAIIQSGWDIHREIPSRRKNNKNIIVTNHNKKQQHLVMKKPVYDVLSYTLSIAVKMTALANHNHLVIGDPMYNRLDYKERSGFQRLQLSPDIWAYACRNSEGNMYNLYTDV
jgi:adenylate cyclase